MVASDPGTHDLATSETIAVALRRGTYRGRRDGSERLGLSS